MTERDLKDQETVQEPVEELEETASNSVEESDTELAEKEVDTADNSEFFQQWKARHQAYLSSKMQDDEQEETQEEKESHPSLQHLKKLRRRRKSRKLKLQESKGNLFRARLFGKVSPSFWLVSSSLSVRFILSVLTASKRILQLLAIIDYQRIKSWLIAKFQVEITP